MSTVVKRSREEYEDVDGVRTASVEYLVKDAATAVDAQVAPGLPRVGDELTPGSGLFAHGHQLAFEDRSIHCWSVRVLYVPQSAGGIPGAPENFRIDTDRQAQLVDTYRVETPSNRFKYYGTDEPAMGHDHDIRGLAIDLGGSPSSWVQLVHVITITFETFAPPNELVVVALQGKRNSSVWRGYGKGSVLYKGLRTSSKGSNKYVHSHEFVADQFWHLRQVAWVDSTGLVRLKEEGDTHPAGPESGCAAIVNWYQPFAFTGPFAAIGIPFPAGGPY